MNEVVRNRLSEKETFKQRPKDKSSHARRGLKEEAFLSRGNSRCKDPKVEKRLT